MTRLPRQPSRVKPPLRGRAATQSYRGEFAPIASVRYPQRPHGSRFHPPISPSCPEQPISPPLERKSLYGKLLKFYQHLIRLIQSLKQPWQWLIALTLILCSLLLLNQLL